MKERLTNNLGLKILSVVLAVFMWLIMVNVSNPLVTDSQEVPVEVLNESILEKANLTYELVGKKTVTVNYEVRIRDQYKITSSDFYASADLADLYDVTGTIPVEVEIANRGMRTLIEGTPTAKPGVVRIQTEPLQHKKFVLETRAVGEPEDGFAQGQISVNPEYIYATGAESNIGKINSLGIEVNIEGAKSDMSGTAKVHFYDSNGNELQLSDEVKLSLEEVGYSATILQVKSLALDFKVSGEAADGYRFTGVESDISSVTVQGLRNIMAGVNTLTVPKDYLSVEGATEDVVVAVDLADVLPDSMDITEGTQSVVQVTLKVEALEDREIEVRLDDIEIEGRKEGYSYNFGTDYVVLTVRGLTEDLDGFSDEDVALKADVSELEEGLQPISFEATLSEGFEMMGHGPMMIFIKADDAGSEDEETSTSTRAAER